MVEIKRKIVLDSAELCLFTVGLPSNLPTCVTFSALSNSKPTGEARSGFAENFFATRQIPAIHFISKRNHWWHVPEMSEFVQKAKELLAPCERAVGYGVSMGAYGCLRFASDLGLDAVAAFSPQYSADPRIVPWEKRWLIHRSKIKFQEVEMSFDKKCEVLIFYDPLSLDGPHVDLLMKRNTVFPIKIPGQGHHLLKYLQARGVLSEIIFGIVQKKIKYGEILELVDKL